ncbi:MAG: hypothetical protein F9K25_17655 [Candidatus Contendobacter sp.]|nr:MAG: hypothetical protein F9K25_17655 [Candidatus Contendobacter sp.]
MSPRLTSRPPPPTLARGVLTLPPPPKPPPPPCPTLRPPPPRPPPPPRASTSTLTSASIGPMNRATVIARLKYVQNEECMVKPSGGYLTAFAGWAAGAASRNLIF